MMRRRNIFHAEVNKEKYDGKHDFKDDNEEEKEKEERKMKKMKGEQEEGEAEGDGWRGGVDERRWRRRKEENIKELKESTTIGVEERIKKG